MPLTQPPSHVTLVEDAQKDSVWKRWINLFYEAALTKDRTKNVSVGYTTDVEEDEFSATVTPDLTLEHLKTMTVTSNFTLNVPTGGNGACEYYLTVTGTGPYTMTAGTNVKLVDATVTLTVGEFYILNIHKFSSTVAVAQLIELA